MLFHQQICIIRWYKIETGEIMRRRGASGSGAGIVIEQRDGQGESTLLTVGKRA